MTHQLDEAVKHIDDAYDIVTNAIPELRDAEWGGAMVVASQLGLLADILNGIVSLTFSSDEDQKTRIADKRAHQVSLLNGEDGDPLATLLAGLLGGVSDDN